MYWFGKVVQRDTIVHTINFSPVKLRAFISIFHKAELDLKRTDTEKQIKE